MIKGDPVVFNQLRQHLTEWRNKAMKRLRREIQGPTYRYADLSDAGLGIFDLKDGRAPVEDPSPALDDTAPVLEMTIIKPAPCKRHDLDAFYGHTREITAYQPRRHRTGADA